MAHQPGAITACNSCPFRRPSQPSAQHLARVQCVQHSAEEHQTPDARQQTCCTETATAASNSTASTSPHQRTWKTMPAGGRTGGIQPGTIVCTSLDQKQGCDPQLQEAPGAAVGGEASGCGYPRRGSERILEVSLERVKEPEAAGVESCGFEAGERLESLGGGCLYHQTRPSLISQQACTHQQRRSSRRLSSNKAADPARPSNGIPEVGDCQCSHLV
jgi:hypothetical protein